MNTNLRQLISGMILCGAAMAAFAPGISHAQQTSQGSCVTTENDPYTPDARYPRGPHRGKCIRTELYRNVVTLTPAPHRTIANVYHKGAFVIARIDTASVTKLVLQLDHFQRRTLNAGAHAQWRISFSRPIELFRQGLEAPGESTRAGEASELIFSYEGVGYPRAMGFANLLDAVLGRGVGVFRVTTPHTFYQTYVAHPRKPHRVEQWEIENLPQEKLAEFVESWVARSESEGMENPYRLLFGANCISVAETAFDSAVRGGPPPFAGGLRFLFGWYPGFTKQIVDLSPGITVRRIADFDDEVSAAAEEYRRYAEEFPGGSPAEEPLPAEPE